jgi:DNA-directed RNA polymerase subunit RPC12/RpoP
MVVKILLCQMCGARFETEVIDRDHPRERQLQGHPVTCPKCGSPRVEVVRTLRRVRSAG